MLGDSKKKVEGYIQSKESSVSVVWLERGQMIFPRQRIFVADKKNYGVIASYNQLNGRAILSEHLKYVPLLGQYYCVMSERDAIEAERSSGGSGTLEEEASINNNDIENEASSGDDISSADDSPSIIPLASSTPSLFDENTSSSEETSSLGEVYSSSSSGGNPSASVTSSTDTSVSDVSTRNMQALASADSLHVKSGDATNSSSNAQNNVQRGRPNTSSSGGSKPNLSGVTGSSSSNIQGSMNVPQNNNMSPSLSFKAKQEINDNKIVGVAGTASARVGDMNVGRTALVNNPNMAEPDKSPLDKEKEKNSNRLKDQLQKNAIRSIHNAIFSPNSASSDNKDTDSEEKDDSSDDEGDSPRVPSDDNEDDNSKKSKFEGKLTLKKVKLIAFIVGVSFFILILSIPIMAVSDFGDLMGIDSGGNPGNIDLAAGNDENLRNLYNNINDIQKEYENSGKRFSSDLIVSIYHILSRYSKDGFSAYTMNNSVIRTIADKMFQETCTEDEEKNKHCSYGYSEELLRTYLKEDLFPQYIKNHDIDSAVDEVFTYISDYQEFLGGSDNSGGAFAGGCYIGGDTQASSGFFDHMSQEEYLNFMGPIANQVYAETGIFASVTLAQSIIEAGWGKATPANSNNLFGIKCGGTGHPPSTWDGSCSSPTLTQEDYGSNGNYTTIKDRFRSYKSVEEGILDHGALLVNADTYVRHQVAQAITPEEQVRRLYAAGYANDKDYVSKIMSAINSYNLEKWDTKSASKCSTTASGDFSTWRQGDSRWGSIHLGKSNDTISQSGCLVTSLAMLIMKYNIPTTISGEFNPGTFVETLNKNNGFQGALFRWDLSPVTPTFRRVQDIGCLSRSRSEKLKIIKDGLSKGYAVMVEVKGNTGQHWVAVDSVSGSDVIMMDPASEETKMWDRYNYKNTSRIVYFGSN